MKPGPPSFQESNRCDVCKCSFTTFRRRHHCRCCGRTLCSEHSSNQMPLPQFGLHSNVRVCSDCFNSFSKFTTGSSGPSLDTVDSISESVTRLDMNGDSKQNSGSNSFPSQATSIPDCKCGMPLCICEVSLPPTPVAPVQTVVSSSSTTSATSKKPEGMRQRRSTQDSRQSSTVSVGPSASGSDKPRADYEANGEGLREAIKSGDLAGVKDLLDKGVDSNYCDKQGMSLLHLAAVFNQTDIVFTLMDHGARMDCKNFQGETPMDCAPATLQFKMKKKIEDGFL